MLDAWDKKIYNIYSLPSKIPDRGGERLGLSEDLKIKCNQASWELWQQSVRATVRPTQGAIATVLNENSLEKASQS